MRRILAVARVELLRLMRSRTSFTMLLLVPAFQVLLFGYAIRPSGGDIPVAVAAPTAANADSVAARLRGVPHLTIAVTRLAPGQAAEAVRDGRALIGIEVPAMRSFANPLQVQRPLRIIVDGTNPILTDAAVQRIAARYWHELAERGGTADTGPGIDVERLYNPQSRAEWTFLPALIGVTVMIAMIMLGSLSVARDRETGTWQGLLALPLGRVEILAGKQLPYLSIGTAQGVLVLAVGVALFELPVRGSIGALIALLPLFAAAHFTLGYAVSVRAATQLAALQGAIAFYLPAMLLSGFLYPFDTLPVWAQTIGTVFPLTHFIRAAQGALLQGKGAFDVLAHGWPMLAFLAAGIGLTLLPRSARLD